MPIYDYVCHHCGHRFEVVHGLHEEGPKACPVCHSNEVRKGFAAPAIHFKGSGWAKKDRSAAARPSAGSKSDGKGGTESPASTEASASSSDRSGESSGPSPSTDAARDSSAPSSTGASKSDSPGPAATSTQSKSSAD